MLLLASGNIDLEAGEARSNIIRYTTGYDYSFYRVFHIIRYSRAHVPVLSIYIDEEFLN